MSLTYLKLTYTAELCFNLRTDSTLNNKAPDAFGVTNEYIKLAVLQVAFLLVGLINQVCNKRNLTDDLHCYTSTQERLHTHRP